MIDRGDCPSGNRPLQQYLGFTAGRWLWSVRSMGLTARLQNSKKRAERSGEISAGAESPRLSPCSGYLHHRLPVAAVNHYRDNAITFAKAQRDKMPENWLANAAITDMQDASA